MSLKKNIIAFFVISILGTLGHFIYEWTNENYFCGLFFPVNESTWEHLKLLFFPTVIYSAAEYLILKDKPKNFLPAVVISVICGMLTIIVSFYTVKGVLGYSIDFINIAIYYIGVLVMLFKKRKIISSEKFSIQAANWFFAAIGFVIAILFIIFSFNPPNLAIFIPPVE